MKIFYFKKATEVMSEWFFWIFFGIAATLLILVIVNIANTAVAEASKIPQDLEDKIILTSRFYNSEDCFAYKDEVGRVHARVIDPNKFKQENIEKCFPTSNVKYAFSLSLEALDFNNPPSVILNLGPVNTFNWEGAYALKEITENVIVLHNNIKYNAKLRIKVKNA